jgi:hypothetical protein
MNYCSIDAKKSNPIFCNHEHKNFRSPKSRLRDLLICDGHVKCVPITWLTNGEENLCRSILGNVWYAFVIDCWNDLLGKVSMPKLAEYLHPRSRIQSFSGQSPSSIPSTVVLSDHIQTSPHYGSRVNTRRPPDSTRFLSCKTQFNVGFSWGIPY